MDTKPKSKNNAGGRKVDKFEDVDISKLLEGLKNGTDSACKANDPIKWRKQFEKAICMIAIKTLNANEKTEEYSEEVHSNGGRVIGEKDGTVQMDPKYKELMTSAHDVLVNSVKELTDVVKPSPEIEKWMKDNDGRNYVNRMVPIEDIVVFEDGYGRGSVFSYPDDDDENHISEVDEYETLYVRVLGTVTDEDHEILKELETAACFLSRNGDYLPMKERVTMVMDAFVKVFRPGWRWAFFIPHFVGSC